MSVLYVSHIMWKDIDFKLNQSYVHGLTVSYLLKFLTVNLT